MTQKSIFWVVDYIKSHKDKETRYSVDLYLLRQGYDAGTIEDAWQIAGLPLENKKLSFFNNLFPVSVICNIMSWYCIFISWQSEADRINHPTNGVTPFNTEFYQVNFEWGLNPTLTLIPLVVWSLIYIMVIFSPASTPKYFKGALICCIVCISPILAFNLVVIAIAYDKMTWQGPGGLIAALVIALTCNILQLKYYPKKVEVVLSAHSSK